MFVFGRSIVFHRPRYQFYVFFMFSVCLSPLLLFAFGSIAHWAEWAFVLVAQNHFNVCWLFMLKSSQLLSVLTGRSTSHSVPLSFSLSLCHSLSVHLSLSLSLFLFLFLFRCVCECVCCIRSILRTPEISFLHTSILDMVAGLFLFFRTIWFPRKVSNSAASSTK